MNVTLGSQTLDLLPGTTVRSALAAFDALTPHVLAATLDSRVVELNDVLPSGGCLAPLTLQDEEGRRIYERSLRFVLLLAVEQCFPGQQVRIEYSVSKGVLVRLPGMTANRETAQQLCDKMHTITRAALPFEKQTWSLAQAVNYFAQTGQPDKVKLLRYRTVPYFNMYCCGGMWEYFYGAMADTTSAVSVFDLQHHPDGFLLLMPDADDPAHVAPCALRPKYLSIFQQSAQWCDILGVVNVADLAELLEKKEMRFFIRVNEALHEQAIGAMAREIVSTGKRVVLIAGPSSSGKTTFAGRLAVQLRVLGRKSHRISLDDYYLDRDKIAPEADGTLDLESIHTLDLPLLQQHVRALMRGEEVEVPRFSFHTGKRCAQGIPLRLQPQEMVILEGIHGLNPMLSEGMPEEQIYRVFVSALTCINLDDHNRIRTTDVRLLRRLVRDHLFRGTPPEQTLAMWPSVRRGEEKWIFPYQEKADRMFNTALHYELPILRHYAYPHLCAVKPDDPNYLLASRLRKTLNYLPPIDEALLSEIPPLSLLREFIGGCTIDCV